LCLKKGGYKLHIKFLQRDLSRDMDGLFQNDPDLVTASALFDLVSDDWLARFVDMITKKRCSVYALLTYDGAEIWQPSLPLDEAVHAGFLAHQHRDKGFGAALGPDAPAALRSHLEAFRFKVDVADSPWRLTQEYDGDLIVALADEIASASCENRPPTGSHHGAKPTPRISAIRICLLRHPTDGNTAPCAQIPHPCG
jgi:hypothetical protein